MRKLLLLAMTAALTACSTDPIEKALKEYKEGQTGENAKYKYEGYVITDTLTVGKKLAEIDEKYHSVVSDPDSALFRSYRNMEFDVYREPGYEEEVMRGSLKDASEWCTEIRRRTETADSLLSRWETVGKYNYDYINAKCWYMWRVFDYDDDYEMKTVMKMVLDSLKEDETAIRAADAFSKADKDSVVGYKVLHSYSIKNPLFKKDVTMTDEVELSTDLRVVSCETKADLAGVLQQAFK